MNFENSHYKVNPIIFFSQTIKMSSSKSHANRALILGAIKGNGVCIQDVPQSTDVTHLLNVFVKIGLKLIHKDHAVTFLNSFPHCERESKSETIDLQTGDGGTTNRFLIPLLALGKKEYRLFPSEKLSQRPIDDLLIPLREIGVSLELGVHPWLKIKGPLLNPQDKKILRIDCSKSTQFASAMKLMVAFNDHFNVEVTNVKSSETYLEMSDAVIAHFKKNNDYTIPVDFSSLSYTAVMAAIAGEVSYSNVFDLDQWQADSQLVPMLKELGAIVEFSSSGLMIKQARKLKPFSFDVSKAPDLFPSLVVLASKIDGVSTFKKLDVLVYKESDRLQEMMKLLDIFQCQYRMSDEGDEKILTITGQSKKYLQSVFIQPVRDHRIVMAAALLMSLNAGGVMTNGDCVAKSYPDFWNYF